MAITREGFQAIESSGSLGGESELGGRWSGCGWCAYKSRWMERLFDGNYDGAQLMLLRVWVGRWL